MGNRGIPHVDRQTSENPNAKYTGDRMCRTSDQCLTNRENSSLAIPANQAMTVLFLERCLVDLGQVQTMAHLNLARGVMLVAGAVEMELWWRTLGMEIAERLDLDAHQNMNPTSRKGDPRL